MKIIREMWMQDGDSLNGPDDDKLIVMPPGEKPEPVRPWNVLPPRDAQFLDQRIAQCAAAARVNVMARLPYDQINDCGSPYGLTVKQFVEKSLSRRDVKGKWRGGVLLLTGYEWIDESAEAAVLSWSVARLLGIEAPAGHVPTLDHLAKAASANLSDPQARRLASLHKNYSLVRMWPELFRLYNERPFFARMLTSERGVELSDVLRNELFQRPTLIERWNPPTIKAVRFKLVEVEGKPQGSAFDIEMMRYGGEWRLVLPIR